MDRQARDQSNRSCDLCSCTFNIKTWREKRDIGPQPAQESSRAMNPLAKRRCCSFALALLSFSLFQYFHRDQGGKGEGVFFALIYLESLIYHTMSDLIPIWNFPSVSKCSVNCSTWFQYFLQTFKLIRIFYVLTLLSLSWFLLVVAKKGDAIIT